MATHPFRESAGFGKRIEFWIMGQMIKYGLDVYVPLVDDMGIDAVVRKRSGLFVEVQIKARSRRVKVGTEAQFSIRSHEVRKNYWFVFYSEFLHKMWIMTSKEFVARAAQTKTGQYEGLRYINFEGKRKNRASGLSELRFQEYEVPVGDFSRIEERRKKSDFDPDKELPDWFALDTGEI
jgi:hypothetical protein